MNKEIEIGNSIDDSMPTDTETTKLKMFIVEEFAFKKASFYMAWVSIDVNVELSAGGTVLVDYRFDEDNSLQKVINSMN